MSRSIVTVNPYTLVQLQSYPLMEDSEVDDILDASVVAQRHWRVAPVLERVHLLERLALALEQESEELARLMAREMGKPIRQGRGEVAKCAMACRYYAERGPQDLAAQMVNTEAKRSYVSFQPLGVILAVMPWNFPFWQVVRALAPNLMVGNGVVLKHASNSTGCALALERLMVQVGAPSGLFRTLLVDHDQVQKLIADPRIHGVTLTGSTPAGREVAASSGRALKKTVLELGGSDPYVVLKDAKLPAAALRCAESRLINSGQSCIAAKRFIVEAPIYEEFLRHFQAHFASQVMGDPLNESTDIGPLARLDLRDELHRQVQRARQQGAQVLMGGEVSSARGAFYPPTVLVGVQKSNEIYREELFGPVAMVFSADSPERAVQIANDSHFGLGAAVWTADLERGEAIARDHLKAGSCFVNHMVQSDPRLPFGGIKESGYGRELGLWGLHEFANVKTVAVFA